MRPPRPAPGFVASVAMALASIALAACNGGGRFPTCKSDTDCAARSTAQVAPHCFELRCVACRSDGDCGAGKACNVANECRSIGGEAAAVGDAGAEPIEKESWEPSTSEDRDRCIAACKGKGKDCLKRCGPSPRK